MCGGDGDGYIVSDSSGYSGDGDGSGGGDNGGGSCDSGVVISNGDSGSPIFKISESPQ